LEVRLQGKIPIVGELSPEGQAGGQISSPKGAVSTTPTGEKRATTRKGRIIQHHYRGGGSQLFKKEGGNRKE